MATQNNIEQQILDLLVTKNFQPAMKDKNGQDARETSDAKLFSFDYVGDSGKNYGTMVIVLDQDNDLKVMYGDNLGRTMAGDDKDNFFDFIMQINQIANRNRWTHTVTDLSKLKYVQQGLAAIQEGLFEGYYGTRKISYTGEPTEARLMIKHNHVLGENDKRYRYVESLYIETVDLERFKLGFKYLAGGRAMLEHVRQGGKPYDVRGNHITEMVNEIGVLSRFNRASAGRVMEGVTAELITEAQHYYKSLREDIKRMGNSRGYAKYFESWHPAVIAEQEGLVEDIKTLFVEQTLDARIEAALPVLARLQQGKAMKEAEIFENWANQVVEGTWAMPDTPEARDKLDTLLMSELPVGPDAANANEQLYDVFGDDELFDRLAELAREDADADARPVIIARMEELGMKVPDITGSQTAEPVPVEAPVSEGDNLATFEAGGCNMTAEGEHCPEHGLMECSGMMEASPEATFNALKGLKSWQVVIMNNYYRGKYSDYSGRYYYVLATSPEQARQVVLDNADAILQDLLSMKSVNGRKILPRSSAIPITDKRIGDIKDGTEAGRMSTAGFKRMFSPQGPMMVKLSGGAVVDVQGQEQGVAEASIPYALSAANYNAEFERQHKNRTSSMPAGGGYRGRVELDVESKEDYIATGRALKKAADAAGQHIEYGLSGGVMKVFSDSMTTDELDTFIDDTLENFDQGVAEGSLHNPGEEDSPVAQVIIRRILLQRTDLLAKYGPERVGSAVDEVADFVGNVDEIGSSDVSGWVKHVEQMLGNMEHGMAEGNKIPTDWMGVPTRLAKNDKKPVKRPAGFDEYIKQGAKHGFQDDPSNPLRKKVKEQDMAEGVDTSNLTNIAQATGKLKGREAFVWVGDPRIPLSNRVQFKRGIIDDREQNYGIQPGTGSRYTYWLKDEDGKDFRAPERDVFVSKQGVAEGNDDPINYNAAITGSYYEGKEDPLARIKSLALRK